MAAQAHAGTTMGPNGGSARRCHFPRLFGVGLRQWTGAVRGRRHRRGHLVPMSVVPDTRPLVLQLCPFSPYMEEGLRARFRVERWHSLDAPAQARWLARHGADVAGIATAGNVGCPPSL